MAKVRNDCVKEIKIEIDGSCVDPSLLANNNECCDKVIDKIDDLSIQSERCCKAIQGELKVIEDKIKPQIKIVKEPIIVKEYIEIRTTVYVPVKTPKPPTTQTLPPSTIPPSSIPGWIWDDVNKYYYKIKRGTKYIKINDSVWREDEYIKLYKQPIQRSTHFHFDKTQ